MTENVYRLYRKTAYRNDRTHIHTHARGRERANSIQHTHILQLHDKMALLTEMLVTKIDVLSTKHGTDNFSGGCSSVTLFFQTKKAHSD